MTTLHIDVQINDLAAWKAGYAEHADSRRLRGVRNAVVRHPVGDNKRLMIDLDFDTTAEAEGFLHFLRDEVWKDQPILAAPPEVSILEPLPLG
jgi:hypothetical protein